MLSVQSRTMQPMYGFIRKVRRLSNTKLLNFVSRRLAFGRSDHSCLQVSDRVLRQ